MTPRHEVLMLELEATSAEAVALIRKVARPRMLVQSRVTGEVVGIVTLADVFNVVSRREALDLRALVVDVPVVSDQADALDVLVVLHKSVHHIALVYDEYGHFEGIITTDDVLEAITGAVSSADADEPALLVRAVCWCQAGCLRMSSVIDWDCRAGLRGNTTPSRGWCCISCGGCRCWGMCSWPRVTRLR
jgi:putative hemolysin